MMKEIVDKLNQKIENGLIVELPNGVCHLYQRLKALLCLNKTPAQAF